jgi:hypothetical protein
MLLQEVEKTFQPWGEEAQQADLCVWLCVAVCVYVYVTVYVLMYECLWQWK